MLNRFLIAPLAALALLAATALTAHAQTGGVTIGAAGAPDASAALDVRSTVKGLLPPRMTQAQRLAIYRPAQGLVVYQTDGTAALYCNYGDEFAPNWQALAAQQAPVYGNFIASGQQLSGSATARLDLNSAQGSSGLSPNYSNNSVVIQTAGLYRVAYNLVVAVNGSTVRAQLLRNGISAQLGRDNVTSSINIYVMVNMSDEAYAFLQPGDEIAVQVEVSGPSYALTRIDSGALTLLRVQ